MVHVIESMGHTALRCSNGRRAFESLMDNPDFALLITDINMPEMTGEELAAVLLGEGGFSSIPIVVCSGTIQTGTVMDLLKKGAATCLSKPLSPERLREVIEEYVDEDAGKRRSRLAG